MQNSESNLYVQDVKANDERDNTLVLLKILALGKREIEEGKFKDKKDVFAELKIRVIFMPIVSVFIA
jgi:hypothetical protein